MALETAAAATATGLARLLLMARLHQLLGMLPDTVDATNWVKCHATSGLFVIVNVSCLG